MLIISEILSHLSKDILLSDPPPPPSSASLHATPSMLPTTPISRMRIPTTSRFLLRDKDEYD